MQYRPEETRKYVAQYELAAEHFGSFYVQWLKERDRNLEVP
jgi:hypothetical protein